MARCDAQVEAHDRSFAADGMAGHGKANVEDCPDAV